MSKDNVIDSLGRIDDDMIRGVEALRRKRKRSGWIRWGTMAACLCLVIASAVMWNQFSSQEKPAEGAVSSGNDALACVWPEGIDPEIAMVAVYPAGAELADVADAISISISEAEARSIANLGIYLPSTLPEGCRYALGGHFRTMMKDGTEYQMIRLTYERGADSVLTGDTAFIWMVWNYLPDSEYPVYSPEELSESQIDQQDAPVFYIDYGGIYVGIEKLDISAGELYALTEAIG